MKGDKFVSDPEGSEIYKHRYAILVIVLAGVFMSVLDSVVVTIALPNLTEYFKVDISASQWVVTTYPLVETALIIFFGKISEYTGKGKMYMAGLAVFTLSSLMCGLSGSLEELIFFRVVQGIGAAMLFGIAFAIVFQVFPHGERGKVMGILGSSVALAMMVGPPVGGFLVATLGWQYIFWINVPIGAVAAVAALRVMRLKDKCADCLKIDYLGSVLWVTAIVSMMLMLGQIEDSGNMDLMTLVYLTVFASTLAGFILHERRTDRPLLDLSVFKVRSFSFGGLSMALFFITSSIVSIVGPFYYEGVMGYGPEQVGLIFMILPAVMMFGAPYAGRLLDKTHSKYISPAGHLVRLASFFLLAYAFFAVDFLLTLVAFIIMGIGSSLFKSPNETEVMLALPKEKTGVASSVTGTVRNMSVSLGLTFGTLILVLQMGSADLGVIQGGPIASALATAVAVSMLVGGLLSLIGAYLSLVGNSEIEPEPAGQGIFSGPESD